jgi:hypothetical protein
VPMHPSSVSVRISAMFGIRIRDQRGCSRRHRRIGGWLVCGMWGQLETFRSSCCVLMPGIEL